MDRYPGTVKWFDSGKGFGMIETPGGPDVFIHYSALKGTGYRELEAGQRIIFAIVQGTKGPQAKDVEVL